MSLETSGLWKLAHKKSEFYESSSRHNEPKSEPSENIYNRTNSSISGRPSLFTYPQAEPNLYCIDVKGQLFYSLNIYSLFSLNPSDSFQL